MRRARVLILAFYGGLGHVVRCARVGQVLRERGVDVLFASAPAAEAVVESARIPYVPIDELPPFCPPGPGEPPAASRPIRLAGREYLRECLAQERRIIRDFQPDFVLVDFRVTGAVSAALESVPSGWIVNTGFFTHPFPGVLEDVVPELVRQGVESDVAERILGDILYIPDWSPFDPLSTVTNNASRAALSRVDEIRHVGPILRQSVAALPGRQEAKARLGVDGDSPVVYVSLGGTAGGRDSLITVAGLLGELGAFSVVVTGPNIPVEAIPEGAADRVLRFTDESMLWTRAADLVITHGGHTSTMEALCAGTPLLAVPGHAEQRWNASHACSLGVGRIVEKDDIGVAFVAAASDMLVDESLRGRAATISEALRPYDGAEELADHVMQFSAIRRLRQVKGRRP